MALSTRGAWGIDTRTGMYAYVAEAVAGGRVLARVRWLVSDEDRFELWRHHGAWGTDQFVSGARDHARRLAEPG